MSLEPEITQPPEAGGAFTAVRDALEALERFSADVAGAEVGGPRQRITPAVAEQFTGIVRSTPCSSNSPGSYSDARYYLDRAVPRHTLSAGDPFDAEIDTLPGVRGCLTATNLAEIATGTHLLPVGTIVQVFALYTRARPGAKLYVFNQPPPASVVVQITGAASGGGKYTGTIVAGSSTATSAENRSSASSASRTAANAPPASGG